MPHQWIEPQDSSVPHNFIEAVQGHPLVAQTLYRRGLHDIASVQGHLDPAQYRPSSPWDLPDMDIAVESLWQAIHAGKCICVWGDFDVDGQTSTALLVSILKDLKANVIHHIPVRSRESHGINVEILKEYITQGIDLLLTCDTGITAATAVHLARQFNLPVIITDHHELPDELPPAQAIINPKRLPSQHPLATLPGVGVVYKLAEALSASLEPRITTECYLDLVALGIVADLAPLVGDTRYLLQCGLPILREMQRPGLRIMAELAELNPLNITEEHISFVLAPRLNALGRLGDANSSVEFLTTTDPLRARILAYELEGLNANRKLLSDQVYRAALSQLDVDSTLLQSNVIVLGHPTWPSGVIGIVAAQLVERFDKPVILFSTPPGQSARGSARSIAGINITEAIASQATLLENFGGHPMAAGLSLQPDRIPDFKRGLVRAVASQSPATPQTGLRIDGLIELNAISPDLVSNIERLAPFGSGNPPVILAARNLTLSGYMAVGKHGEHLLVTLEDQRGYTQQAIWWQGADQPIPEHSFDLAFTVRNATYRGQKGIQVEWIDWRISSAVPVPLSNQSQTIVVFDHRHEPNPQDTLTTLISSQDVQIWSETADAASISGKDRLSLSPCDILVIWSPPPSPSVLRDVILQTKPRLVYLFGHSTTMDQPSSFLNRLAGLCKYTLNKQAGQLNIGRLAAATNQRLETVIAGLHWLQAHGHIEIIEQQSGHVKISEGVITTQDSRQPLDIELKALLRESAAYRKYYLKEDKDRLINFPEQPSKLD